MHAPSVLDSRYSWKRLALTLLIATICNVGMWSIIVIMPEVQSEFATTRAAASIPYTLTMAGFALGNLVIGRAVDRFGITLGAVGAAAALGVGYTVRCGELLHPSLSAFQFLIGLGTAAGFGPLIADSRTGSCAGAASRWPSLLAATISGASGRPCCRASRRFRLAGGLFCACRDHRRPRDAAAGAVAAAPVPASRFLGSAADGTRLGPGAERFSPRTLQWLLGLAGIGCCVAMSMPQVHIVSLCVRSRLRAGIGAEMLSLMLMGGVASRLASGLIADRLGGVRDTADRLDAAMHRAVSLPAL
jgi:hypothetical protein